MNNVNDILSSKIRSILMLLVLFVGMSSDAWGDTWVGTKSSTLSTKDGTTTAAGSATNPYLIQSAADFAYLMIDKAGQSWYVELTTDLNMDGANRTWTGGQNKTYKGHFEGNGHTISNVRVAFAASGNYGVFGNITGASTSNKAEVKNVKLDNITLECTSTASFSYNGRTGAVAGYAKWAVVDNVTATNIKATYKANVGMTSSNTIGGLLGYATDIVDVTNCTVDGYTIEIPGATTGLILGGLIGQTTNSGTNSSINVIGNTVKGAVMNITTNTSQTASAPNIGGLIGFVKSDATSGTPAKIYKNTITKSTTAAKSYTGKSAKITIDGLATGNFYVGGFIGTIKGKSSPSYRALVKANTVEDVVVSHTNATNAGNFRMGGFIGYVDQHCDILNNTVTRPQVKKQGAIKAITCVGGAIGYTTDYSVVDGLYVKGGSITGPTASTAINNSVVAAFGGVLGYKNASSNTYNNQVAVFKNVVINDFNIDLGNYTSADGKIQNWKFFVGGVIGTLGDARIGKEGTTSSMPENLVSKSVKIYAPLAVVSPLVAHFNNGGAVSYTNYFMQDKSTFDDVERSKVGSWVYNDFKVGLSSSVQSNIANKLADYNAVYANGLTRRNYDAAQKETIDGVDYISVDNLKKNNRIYDFETDSKTVLWWTKQDGVEKSANNDIEQNIYPSSGATSTGTLTNTYPYWMYYYQGVNYGTKLEDTESNSQITNIINGINANFTQAQAETPVTLTIADAQDKARGFDAHNLTVTASDEGSYTYNWYVDGESQAGTGSTLSVKPEWKTGKSIIVNAIDASSNIIASTSFTLKHGVLHTKTSYDLRTSEPQDLTTDYIGMSYTARGTEDNPYIIDCPEALKQWSYLSTYPNAWNFEGLVANGRTALHWNRAWFELGEDIDLGTGETADARKANPGDFTPISHVATSNSASFGTYNQSFIFCGHFDGKGYAIKNFKVTWAGGRYNGGGNQYFGLFGAVGWGVNSPTEPCVIQNLVIDNAQLVHDDTNTSFCYNNAQTTNKNNVYLGVLAGVVSSNTTIQNIEVRNSSITDANDSHPNYNIAGQWLCAGGIVGRVQHSAVNGTYTSLANTITLQFLSAHCDIDLTHAKFTGVGGTFQSNAQMRQFNIGGVVGHINNDKGTYATLNMPEYAYFTGKINSPNAIVGPVFASVDFTGLGTNYSDYCKHYMATATTQEIPNLYFGDYEIWDYSATTPAYRTITDSDPESGCTNGSRTITLHNYTHPNNADFYNTDNYYGEYQGVNYGEYIGTSGQQTALEIEIEQAMVAAGIEGYYLIFDGSQMQLVKQKPMKVSILDNTTDATATTHTLQVVNNKGDEGYTYAWYSNGVKVSTDATYNAPIGTTPQLIYVEATETATSTTKNTEAIALPRSITGLTASYSPEKKKDVKTEDVTFSVTTKYLEGVNEITSPAGYTATYKWEQFTKGSVSEETYTEATALEANKQHIVSIKDGSGNTVDEASWTYAMSIGTATGYTVEYEKTISTVEETITTTQYDALSDTEKAKCTSNGDGNYTYTHDVEVTYTPVKSGDKYQSSTSDTWTTLSNTAATLAGADKSKTYRCTITATDGTWNSYVSGLEASSPCYALKDTYPTTFTYDLIVRLRERKVVYLHPVNNTNTAADGVPVGSDTWDGVSKDQLGDKEHPVATWGKAYSLLDGDEGSTWDDNIIVLVGKSDYQTTFGTGKIADRTGGVSGYFSNISHYGLSNVFVRSNNDAVYGDNEVDHPKYEIYKAMIEKSPMGKNVTITGKWYQDDDDTKPFVDYHAMIESPQYCGRTGREFINFYGNTKMEHLTFWGYKDDYDVIFGHYHDLWFGEGLIMKNFVLDKDGYGTIATVNTPRMQVFGGMHGDSRFNQHYDAAGGLMDGKIVESMPNGEKGFTITVRSGFYSIICSGSRQTSNVGLQGSPNRPIKCTIDVDIDQAWNLKDEHDKTMAATTATTPYDIALILAGNHEGAMYADVDIKVKSGRIARIVNGSLGALRATTFKYNGANQNYPKNTYMGRANILLDPASSRFANKGESADAINQRVLVTELYNGGVGRSLGSDGEIDMPSLGKNVFTMKGGTIGYPAETTNWKGLATMKNSDQIFPGVYGGGAGGMNGIGYGAAGDASHTKEPYLPYWEEPEKAVLYGNYGTYITKTGKQHLTIKCYNTDTKDYTYIDPLETSSEINIEGGQLGTPANPINVFGGGSGFTSTWFLRTDRTSYPCTQAGGMYGSSKDAVVTTVNISGGEIYGNVYGAGKGTDYYYANYRKGTSYWGDEAKSKGYTTLGQTYGSVVTNITGGIINGNVYGAGAGVAESKFCTNDGTYGLLTGTAYLSGNAIVNISDNAQIKSYTNGGNTYGGNVYGGGMLAKVGGNTTVNVSGEVNIDGNVFGAAQGITNKAATAKQNISGTTETYLLNTADNAKLFGIVEGNATVTTSGTPVFGKDIYGGAESAITEGNTNVTIGGGTIHDIFGGGLGSLTTSTTVAASANVNGNTTVIVNSAKYANETIPYYIYGGGNLACVVGGKTNVTIKTGIASDQTTVFGGGYGVNTKCGSSTVNIRSFPANAQGDNKVYGLTSVYGGGNQGTVSHTAAVNINGGLILHDVFGGGNEAKVGTAAAGDQLTEGAARNEWANANGTSVSMKNATQKEGDLEVDIPSDAIVYGNIYGGGNKAAVEGNASVYVKSGKFGGDVFGGGNGELKNDNTPSYSADVTNNTSVTVDGAMVIWSKKWDATNKQYIEWDKTWEGMNRNQFVTGSKATPIYSTNHNIYGGGNKACTVSGQSEVTVKKGFADKELLSTLIWKNAFDDSTNPHFYVFGGGYGAFTSSNNTKVTVGAEGTISEDATTDQQLAKRDDADFDGEDNNESGDSENPNAVSKSRKVANNAGNDNADIGVYDNTYGIPEFTVLGVVGGGYAGLIKTTTDVTFGGKTYTHNIYGGGYGQLAAYNSLASSVKVMDNEGDANDKTRDNLGEVGTNTSVNVNGGYVYGDVFGGGAGVESTKSGSSYTDYPDMGRVRGTTAVEVSHSAQVFGNVYGGGDVANVGTTSPNPSQGGESKYTIKPQSASNLEGVMGTVKTYTTAADRHAQAFVNIIGGDIYGQVFAGGNGRLKAEAADYTKLGRIEGNTLLHIANWNEIYSIAPSTPATASEGEEGSEEEGVEATAVKNPTIWGRIYGGGSYGTVDGNTLVHVEGGMLGLNIFGGGYGDVPITNQNANANAGVSSDSSTLEQVLGKADKEQKGTYANILGNTKVQIDGGSWIWNRKSDTQGNITTWKNAGKQLAKTADEARTLMAKIKAAGQLENKLEAYTTIKSLTGLNNDDAEFFDLSSLTFKKNHNIFGGGNRACLVGTYSSNVASLDAAPATNTGNVEIIINHSPVTAIDDGAGTQINMLDAKTLGGMCWYLSTSNVQHPQFSVFGAGYGANTKVGSTDVKIQPGAQLNNQGSFLYPAQRKYVNEFTDLMTFFNFEDEISTPWDNVTDEYAREHYGAGNNDGKNDDFKTFLRFRASQLAWSLGAPNFTFMDIHGGGYSGYVQGNTNVTTDCQLACRNVFGAGLGAKPADALANQTAADALTFGSIGGNATVLIKSGTVSLNVFGGGAGVESIKYGDNYLDFPNIARVKGKTNVKVYGEMYTMPNDASFSQYMPVRLKGKGFERVLVFGSVYGGGDVANVGSQSSSAAVLTEASTDFTTTVGIYGASILSQAYAGGSGRYASECNDYTKLGAVYGNTRFVLDAADDAYPYEDNDITPPSGVVKPYMWNRIYGGCQNGTVYGNTFIHIKDGWVSHNMFGGGWGNVSTDLVSGETVLTSADVIGNTNILITGGEAKMSSYWDYEKRAWWSAVKSDKGLWYSPQYDPVNMKFLINHNVYGGGNAACEVKGSTYINMKKGLLFDNTVVLPGNPPAAGSGYNFFEQNEWKEVYNKVGSPHFGVFGGGYGEMTNIVGDTHVDVNLSNGNTSDAIANAGTLDDKANLYKHFVSKQSVMDIVGGGYNGSVKGSTNINVGGDTFCRRIFGGGFYAPVGASNVNITSVDCNDIFGGGLMGDIGYSATAVSDHNSNISNYQDGWEPNGKSTVTIGYADGSSAGTNRNSSIYIHNNIYGGNDVSGAVKKLATVNVYGGHVFGNVYGAGNGDYLYALAKYDETKVTVNDQQQYDLDGDDTQVQYPLVYSVPMRESMASAKSASNAQKIVNINSWRPVTLASAINIKGNSSSDNVTIAGKVFGGGNSATIKTSEDAPGTPSVTFDIGSHVNIGEVYMGSDGEAMLNENSTYLDNFATLNNVNLSDTIIWNTDPANHGITTTYLPTENPERPLVYPHLLDLYFQPISMNVQATLNWAGTAEGGSLTDCTIGTFCCGGNRGNMNVYPYGHNASDVDKSKYGSIVDYIFPAGLTITNKIVGGCNNANYPPVNGITVYHTGGYLLGKRSSTYPMIKLTVKSQFSPSVISTGSAYTEGLNVYGGCYERGTINGDVMVDFRSDMLKDLEKIKLDQANEDEIAVGNIYGAGYGMESYVYGNVKVLFGANANGSANYIFGGGQQGNVIGNTLVRIYNGHINQSVAGGSYAGYQYGSTQVLVGYPQYYTCQKTGVYNLRRADKWNSTYQNYDGSKTIKTNVFIMKGDIVSSEVFEAIQGYDADHTDATAQATTGAGNNFSAVVTTQPSDAGLTWNNIDIKIENAVYGGGYSLASNSSVAAGTATVLKYNKDYNLDDDLEDADLADANAASSNQGTQGFGGNTTVLVWDDASSEGSTDHIAISSQVMSKATNLKEGDDLFKYYYKTGGTYNYVSREDSYFYTTSTEDKSSENKYNDVYESHSDGGLYGDGHLSFAAGFRAGEINGYGFSGTSPKTAKVINTFQRMDMLRVQDCSLALLGARDYTVYEVSTDPYSISRIGELQMVATKVDDTSELKALNVKHSRNYLGFANNIHYVGAITSNVAFSDSYRNRSGVADGSNSYQAVKQSYVNRYKTNKDENTFQKRNDGTSKNMIGISSGYALKLQNVYTNASVTDEKIFYGPIVGVVEMNLINVHADEGGGYVYADNIHHRKAASGGSSAKHRVAPYTNDTAVPATVEGTEDFLETSGNFVFPYDESKHRYIVDDCFPTNYYVKNNSGTGPADDTQESGIHYWYVTGFNYYYNARITGYTYDSSGTPIDFYNSNKDGLMVLSGALKTQEVTLQSIKWRSNHEAGKDGFVACDIETSSTDMATACTEQTVKGSGNTKNAETGVYDHYNLFVNAPVGTTDGKYTDSNAHIANLPLNAADAATYTGSMTPALTTDEPSFTFMLRDQVDNSGNDYFEKYMQQPCEATLVFTVPAKKRNADNTLVDVTGYVSIQEFYTRTGSGTAESPYSYTKVTESNIANNSSTPYFYLDNDEQYKPITIPEGKTLGDVLMYYNSDPTIDATVPVNGRAASTYTDGEIQEVDGKTYVKSTLTNKGTDESPVWVAEFGAIQAAVGDVKTAAVTALDNITLGTDHTYYFEAPRTFTYTVYLTIDYVQGPSVTGDITIENCALPGEMIKLSTKNLKFTSDASLSPDGYYWRIGPRKLVEGKTNEYEFTDANTWSTDDLSSTAKRGYDTYKVGGTVKNGVFADCVYNKDNNTLEIPAYYFMDGYGVEFGFTVSSIGTTLFPVSMTENDKLTVHNYHRMDPHYTQGEIDLHLEQALARAATESTFARPRIYILDETDIKAFPTFINNIGTSTGSRQEVYLGGNLEANKKSVPTNGAYADFFLQSNLTLPSDYTAPTKAFNGTFHGDGHILSGLDKLSKKYLFSSLGDNANIYILGLASGVITKDDAGTTNAKYHCCFTYSPKASSGGDSSPVVYRINGAAITTYTDEDWKYGKVAYDLNQFYLDKRYVTGAAASGSTPSSLAANYVENYYANGDYQYARRSTNFPASTSGIVYLRTTDNEVPAYKTSSTRHDQTHPIDVPRAVAYVSAGASSSGVASYAGYQPLFNNSSITAGIVTDAPQNDYLFFGQSLQATCEAYPNTIASHLTSAATNRVWRASGFYCDKVDEGFHFNALKQGDVSMGTYVHIPTTTAVDFTCQRDEATYVQGHDVRKIYYAPTADLPSTYASFSTDDAVTRNLLVYTAAGTTADNEAYDVVHANSGINYDASTAESSIKAHQIIKEGSNNSTALFHLVERADDSDPNNDFFCPISFTVTEKAWYTRKPAYYAEATNTAWEGICLPFSVNNVSASYNGEITHFYGAEEKANAANNNVGHEYWLRGLTGVDGTNGKATFKRPGTEEDHLFTGGTLQGSYSYTNTHFRDVYGKYYESGDIYAQGRTYSDYYFQQQNVPYIVSFPGSTYHEFDLSGKFNESLMNGKHNNDWDAYNDGSHPFSNLSTDPQNVTFSWIVDNDDKTKDGNMLIPVTNNSNMSTNGSHHGTFLAKAHGGYGMNSDGTAFDDEVTEVLPFRTYMTNTSSSAKPRRILIYEGTGIEELPQQETNDTNINDMTIYSKDCTIIIESTYATKLRLFTTAGQLVRVLDVIPGTNTYDNIQQGIYIVGKKKLYVK